MNEHDIAKRLRASVEYDAVTTTLKDSIKELETAVAGLSKTGKAITTMLLKLEDDEILQAIVVKGPIDVLMRCTELVLSACEDVTRAASDVRKSVGDANSPKNGEQEPTP